MTRRVWMAQTKQGRYLCHSRLDPLQPYYLCNPLSWEPLSQGDWLMCRTRREISAHLRKWHRELRCYARMNANRRVKDSLRQERCHPVRMVVSWEPETRGGGKDTACSRR